jgi:hypothetical protein
VLLADSLEASGEAVALAFVNLVSQMICEELRGVAAQCLDI